MRKKDEILSSHNRVNNKLKGDEDINSFTRYEILEALIDIRDVLERIRIDHENYIKLTSIID